MKINTFEYEKMDCRFAVFDGDEKSVLNSAGKLSRGGSPAMWHLPWPTTVATRDACPSLENVQNTVARENCDTSTPKMLSRILLPPEFRIYTCRGVSVHDPGYGMSILIKS